MTSRPLDTDPAAWSAYSAVLDRIGGPAPLRAAVELSEAVREIRLAGIQSRHPELSREQVVSRLVLEEYGVALPGPQ
jgi:hypothetical protein